MYGPRGCTVHTLPEVGDEAVVYRRIAVPVGGDAHEPATKQRATSSPWQSARSAGHFRQGRRTSGEHGNFRPCDRHLSQRCFGNSQYAGLLFCERPRIQWGLEQRQVGKFDWCWNCDSEMSRPGLHEMRCSSRHPTTIEVNASHSRRAGQVYFGFCIRISLGECAVTTGRVVPGEKPRA